MKKYLCAIPLVLFICLSFACQDKAAMAELDKFKAQATAEERNKALVITFFDEMNRGNIEFIDEMYTPDCSTYNPSNSPNPMSREGHTKFHKMLLGAFPDINWRIEKVFTAGNATIIWNVITGTHQGEFRGIPATGRRVEVSSILIWTIRDGKIVEEREETNMLGLMQQLGMELRPKEKKK